MAKPVLNAPQFQDRSRRFCLRRGAAMAERSCLPALWRYGAHRRAQRQDDPSWPLQVLRLQEAFHGADRHAV